MLKASKEAKAVDNEVDEECKREKKAKKAMKHDMAKGYLTAKRIDNYGREYDVDALDLAQQLGWEPDPSKVCRRLQCSSPVSCCAHAAQLQVSLCSSAPACHAGECGR